MRNVLIHMYDRGSEVQDTPWNMLRDYCLLPTFNLLLPTLIILPHQTESEKK